MFGIQDSKGLGAIYLQVRGLIAELIRARSRPIWQRLLLIVALCGRLDGVGDHDVSVASELLANYRKPLRQGDSSEFERNTPAVARRLELAIVLSNQRCQDRDCGRRFKDVFWDFIETIGSASSAGAEEDVHRFQHASQSHLEPLLCEAPFMMENCLLNSSSFTLYCAFEIATKKVSGSFEHRDTALEEARFVIESCGKHYPHRLLGFNNDPEITFGMLQQFFDQVSRRVKLDVQDAQAADAMR